MPEDLGRIAVLLDDEVVVRNGSDEGVTIRCKLPPKYHALDRITVWTKNFCIFLQSVADFSSDYCVLFNDTELIFWDFGNCTTLM